MKKLVVAAVIGCTAFGIYFFYKAAREELPYYQAKVAYDNIREDVVDVVEPCTETQETEERRIDFDTLQEKNAEIIGWLYIPGTQVDYPVCRGEDIDFYLHYNAYKEENILGALFVPPENSSDLQEPHVIIYGHNMRQGQMFGELSNYEEKDFFQSYPHVYLYTPVESRVYQIYSVYRCNPSSETYTLGFELGTKAYRDWQTYTIEQGTYETGVEVSAQSRVLTLSTCADGDRTNRLVVNCIEINGIPLQEKDE